MRTSFKYNPMPPAEYGYRSNQVPVLKLASSGAETPVHALGQPVISVADPPCQEARCFYPGGSALRHRTGAFKGMSWPFAAGPRPSGGTSEPFATGP